MSIWTLLRCITNGANFDVVGQVGLADQWAHGQIDGVQLGATNYLLKMPVYFMINQIQAVPPLYRLTLLAIVFNLFTFFLLFKVYEKLMDLYGIKERTWFYLTFVWLATLVGNFLWADYANSRNLEAVGGIFFLYLILKYIQRPQHRSLAQIFLLGTIIFFADPLQLYVCGLGTCAFMAGRAIVKRSKNTLSIMFRVVAATVLAFLLSRLLVLAAFYTLHVSVLLAPNSMSSLTISHAPIIIKDLVLNTLTIFGSNFIQASSLVVMARELINLVILVGVLWAILRHRVKGDKATAYHLALTVAAVNYLIYIASGQVTEWQTARYLIMVPLLVIAAVAILGDRLVVKKYQRGFIALGVTTLAVTSLLIAGGLVVNWPNRYQKDQSSLKLVSFMSEHSFKYALASREHGVTGTYLSRGEAKILPMSCQPNHTLQPTNLFYDNAAFKGLYQYSQDVPIIISSEGIEFGRTTCSQSDIVAQFGAPRRLMEIKGVGKALVYRAASLRTNELDKVIGHSRILTKADVAALFPNQSTYLKPSTRLPLMTGCTQGAIDVFIAHPDDDLLFMNPSLFKNLATHCVRITYVTAADDGRPSSYWLGREHGVEAAYAYMFGAENNWSDKTVLINGHHILTRQLANHPQISLVFLRLPDGGVYGQGFSISGSTSLELLSRNSSTIAAVDSSASYNYSGLTNVLAYIIRTDKPEIIYTQIAEGPLTAGDHSDHRAVGTLSMLARAVAKSDASLIQFVGYPSNGLPPNIDEADVQQKSHIFDKYAEQDGVICNGQKGCDIVNTYGRYFSRSYEVTTANISKKVTHPKTISKKQQTVKKHSVLDLFQRTTE